MAALQASLGTQETKKDIVLASGSVAAGTVTIEVNNDDKQLDVDATIEKLREFLIENFYESP